MFKTLPGPSRSGIVIDRRRLLGAGGGVAAAAGLATSARAATRPWDHQADIVVVGSGAAALSAAVVATAEGVRVIIIEAAATMGGTTARSGGGCWVPNNRHMRAAGLSDPREDAIAYMARYSFPDLYDADAPRLGLPENEHALIAAFFDSASPAFERLETLGALHTRGDVAYDYWQDAPDNRAPVGRAIFPAPPGATQGVGALHPATAATPEWRELNQQLAGGAAGAGGPLMIEQMKTWLAAQGVPVLLNHRVCGLIRNGAGEVIGVEARAGDSEVIRIRGRRAVHFGAGGFTFNAELRRSFLRGPSYGGCAVPTSQGDLIFMAADVGARLGNMQNGWGISLIMEEALDASEPLHSVWHIGGDSMFVVNRHGRRVVNEKQNYGDRNEVYNAFDPATRTWDHQVLFVVFDQRVRDACAGLYPYAPAGEPAPYILQADTLEALADRIGERLEQYAGRTGGFSLAADFGANLQGTFDRFNGFAATGIDEDFRRGATPYDLQWHMRALGRRLVESNNLPNSTLYPLSSSGPYFAVPIVRGNADTNGGPVINARSQILSHEGQPIPGLYGAGNCIASPSGRAYWGAGTTLGLAVTFGSIAALNAVQEPVKAEE